MGTTLGFFQSEGKIPEEMDKLKMSKRSSNRGSRKFNHTSGNTIRASWSVVREIKKVQDFIFNTQKIRRTRGGGWRMRSRDRGERRGGGIETSREKIIEKTIVRMNERIIM